VKEQSCVISIYTQGSSTLLVHLVSFLTSLSLYPTEKPKSANGT
jgi:hypothetical protein